MNRREFLIDSASDIALTDLFSSEVTTLTKSPAAYQTNSKTQKKQLPNIIFMLSGVYLI